MKNKFVKHDSHYFILDLVAKIINNLKKFLFVNSQKKFYLLIATFGYCSKRSFT